MSTEGNTPENKDKNALQTAIEGVSGAVDDANQSVNKAVQYKYEGWTKDAAEKLAAKKFSEKAGFDAEDYKKAIPVGVAAGAGLAGLLLVGPLTKIGGFALKSVKKLVTGFGYFERIPLIGGLFTALGQTVDWIGKASGYLLAGTASVLTFKAFQARPEAPTPLAPETSAPDPTTNAANAAVLGSAVAARGVYYSSPASPKDMQRIQLLMGDEAWSQFRQRIGLGTKALTIAEADTLERIVMKDLKPYAKEAFKIKKAVGAPETRGWVSRKWHAVSDRFQSKTSHAIKDNLYDTARTQAKQHMAASLDGDAIAEQFSKKTDIPIVRPEATQQRAIVDAPDPVAKAPPGTDIPDGIGRTPSPTEPTVRSTTSSRAPTTPQPGGGPPAASTGTATASPPAGEGITTTSNNSRLIQTTNVSADGVMEISMVDPVDHKPAVHVSRPSESSAKPAAAPAEGTAPTPEQPTVTKPSGGASNEPSTKPTTSPQSQSRWLARSTGTAMTGAGGLQIGMAVQDWWHRDFDTKDIISANNAQMGLDAANTSAGTAGVWYGVKHVLGKAPSIGAAKNLFRGNMVLAVAGAGVKIWSEEDEYKSARAIEQLITAGGAVALGAAGAATGAVLLPAVLVVGAGAGMAYTGDQVIDTIKWSDRAKRTVNDLTEQKGALHRALTQLDLKELAKRGAVKGNEAGYAIDLSNSESIQAVKEMLQEKIDHHQHVIENRPWGITRWLGYSSEYVKNANAAFVGSTVEKAAFEGALRELKELGDVVGQAEQASQITPSANSGENVTVASGLPSRTPSNTREV